jgi:hypothetical protein
MPPEEPIPANDYTALAVQLGVIQEGQRNTLAGINDIKETLTNHGDRLGNVESRVAVVTTRVDAHDVALSESRADARPQKGRWANVVSAAAAAVSIAFFVLDRLYAAH